MINASIPRPPYYKGKGFMDKLCPIVRKGIPKEADSRYDKRVVGTSAHSAFWEEEVYKIKNGVICPGVGWVPGRFYYYMNYKIMSTIRGVITPDMVDLHLELAYLIDYCKQNKHNLLCPKGRRKGISEAAHTMLVDYGLRFSYGYKAGVAAGNKTYVEDFISKWRFGDAHLPPELQVKKLVDNDDEIVAGYQYKNEQNSFVTGGTMNTIYARTMHTNPNMFKGLYLNDVISEEIGEHEKWFEFFNATKDALMNGSIQEGMFTAFGTGGQVDKGSKDFKRISYEAETYNFIEFVIPATRFYFYGGATEENRRLPSESEYNKTRKSYELIGVEDLVLAEKHILERRKRLLDSGNTKDYNEDLQNNPLTKAEIFKKSVVNDFDINKLNAQQNEIDSQPKKYSKWKFEYVTDEKGTIKIPMEVKRIPAKNHEDESECVLILDTEPYRKGYRNLYCAGIDSYDTDTSKTSKSLGAMCVLIRENLIGDALKRAPVAVIRCRPRRKEIFYEMCFKLAIYYKLDGNVLVDIAKPLIIEHFKNRGGERYLAERPKKIEKIDSQLQHEFGMSINGSSKPQMVAYMQTAIMDYCQNIWFPDLINELGNYDVVEIGSDNDLADAYGIALTQDVSFDIKPQDMSSTESENDRFKLSWEKNIEGDTNHQMFKNGEMDTW